VPGRTMLRKRRFGEHWPENAGEKLYWSHYGSSAFLVRGRRSIGGPSVPRVDVAPRPTGASWWSKRSASLGGGP